MKKFLLFVGMCAMALLTACSDDNASGSESVADKCKNGLSKGCLQGTWIMPGLYSSATDTAPSLSFSPPDTLYLEVTNEDSSTAEEDFTMVYTSSTKSEDVCGTMYGKWWISGTNTVHFKSSVSDCTKEFDAVVTVNDSQMTFDQSYFHNTLIYLQPGIEIFDRVE